jgi:hypothetical protein
MLTVVALDEGSTAPDQTAALAVALAALARRQEVAVVCDCLAPASSNRLTNDLRSALPARRIVGVHSGSSEYPGAELELISQLLDRGAMPFVIVPPGGVAAAAALLADKLSASALLHLVEPGLAGTGRPRRTGRRRSGVV